MTLAASGGAPVGAGTRTGDGVRALGVGVADGVGRRCRDPADGDDAVGVGAVLPVWVVGIGRAAAGQRRDEQVVTATAATSTRVTGKVLTS